jgi:hypothetical protein
MGVSYSTKTAQGAWVGSDEESLILASSLSSSTLRVASTTRVLNFLSLTETAREDTMRLDLRKAATQVALRRVARARRHMRLRARLWFDRLLSRLGMPSAIPVADREHGAVVWFGVTYQLRSSQGDVPGGVTPVSPAIVYKLPSHQEIGRIMAAAGCLSLSFTSAKNVDQRALRHVAAAWFDGARIAEPSNSATP